MNALSHLIVRRICAVNRVIATPGKLVRRVDRERWALAIKTAGRTLYRSRGVTYLSGSDHVVVLPQGASYTWVCTAPGPCLMIEFESDSDAMNGVPSSIRVDTFSDVVAIAWRLERLWGFDAPGTIARCMAGLYEVLARLVDAAADRRHGSLRRDLIKPSIDYLEAHYNSPALTNDLLAEQSGISTVYFRKVFTSLFGESPMRYVRSIRIEKAKGMLLGDYTSVGSVAAAVGFESIYHFSRAFKSATGYAPTSFSRMHRRGSGRSTIEL